MGLYDDKIRLNREATQVALEFNRATEKDIVEMLNSYVPKYKEMQKQYYSFANGKIKAENAQIRSLDQILQNAKKQAIKAQISLDAYIEYVKYSSSNIEHIIDCFERDISEEEVKQSTTGIVKKIDLVLDKRYCLKDYNYLEYARAKLASYPAPRTSVEKANRFIASYQKKLTSLVDGMIKTRKEKDARIKKIEGLKVEANSEPEKEQFEEFTKKYQEFEKEIYSDNKFRIEQYIKKSPDSEIKKQILKSLNRSKYKAMSKNPNDYELITAKTMFDLVGDVANNLINLNEQTQDKGME